jgi:hypothetical protein
VAAPRQVWKVVLLLAYQQQQQQQQQQQTTKFFFKNLFNSKWRNIPQHFNVTGLCKVFVVMIGC